MVKCVYESLFQLLTRLAIRASQSVANPAFCQLSTILTAPQILRQNTRIGLNKDGLGPCPLDTMNYDSENRASALGLQFVLTEVHNTED